VSPVSSQKADQQIFVIRDSLVKMSGEQRLIDAGIAGFGVPAVLLVTMAVRCAAYVVDFVNC